MKSIIVYQDNIKSFQFKGCMLIINFFSSLCKKTIKKEGEEER